MVAIDVLKFKDLGGVTEKRFFGWPSTIVANFTFNLHILIDFNFKLFYDA